MFAGETEITFATAILGHDDNPVANFDSTRLGNFNDYSGCFMSNDIGDVSISIG